MPFSCAVCGAIEPIILPCGVQKRMYVTEGEGLIIAVSDGCPSEDNDTPIYIGDDYLTHAKKFRDAWLASALKVNYEDYKNLWASWNREDHLLNRDPREALKGWLSSIPSKFHLVHEVRCSRGEASYRAAIHFVQLAERLQSVSDSPLDMLPKAWYPKVRNLG